MTPIADDIRQSVYAARLACRVAMSENLRPRSPLLYYMTYLSVGEVVQQQRRLFRQWFDRCSCIWLFFPDELYSDQRLDGCSYELLKLNELANKRRPVFLLEPHNDEYLQLPLTRKDMSDLLLINLSIATGRATAAA